MGPAVESESVGGAIYPTRPIEAETAEAAGSAESCDMGYGPCAVTVRKLGIV